VLPNRNQGVLDTTMKRSLVILGLALCAGCTTVVVRRYNGPQQNWPTGRAGVVSTGLGMPVFATPPPRPYDVLAELRIKRPDNSNPDKKELPALVKKARSMGADALMFVDPYVFFAVNYGPRTGAATTNPVVGKSFHPDSFEEGVTFLAIKWVYAAATTNTPAPANP
jgi:hypothetical protein